jgi:outer membrane protein
MSNRLRLRASMPSASVALVAALLALASLTGVLHAQTPPGAAPQTPAAPAQPSVSQQGPQLAPQTAAPPTAAPQQPAPQPAASQPAVPVPQTPGTPERITFQEAIDRALKRNPTVAEASSDILRADALLRQARSAIFPQASGSIQTTVVTPVVQFSGVNITPRSQTTVSATASQLLYAPVQWALRNQAADNKVVSERSLSEARRQIALSAAEAFLTVIAQRRIVEVSQLAVDTAKAHFDYAHQLQEKGAGSRLNELRAQEEVSADQVTLENATLAVYRAQEALGVLLASDSPIDTADQPALTLPPTPDTIARVTERTDVQLVGAREQAAQRVLADSWKEYLPTVTGSFTPQYQNPSTLFTPGWSTRTLFGLQINIFDSGLRAGHKAEREAALSHVQLEGQQIRRQASSEIRAAVEAVRSAERAVVSARAAADQAHQVVEITTVAFRAGATTNIEVIDAQRAARDADNAAAVADDTVRRARLDLLVSTGRFP